MFRKHVLQILIICLTLIGYCESASTLTGSRRIAESVNFTLICKDNGPITGNVVFFQNTLPRGGCIPNCGSGVSGYTVTQNKTSQTTFLHIGAVSASRDEGNWTCRQGTNTESPSLNLSQIPSFLPSTSISIQPAIETVAVLQNINVSATCSYPAPKITWTYEKENNVITVSSTSTSISASCPGEQVETTNIFQANSLQDSGRIVLSVTVEHDSFDPPDYQVTFSSMEINLGVCDEHDGRIIAIVVGVVSPSLAAIVGYIVYRISRKEADAVLAAGICLIAVGFSCLVAILVVCTNVSGTSAPIALSLSIIMIIGGIILIITSKMGCWKRCGKGNIGANDEPKDSGQPVGSVPLENGKPENGSPDK